ncbi:MAG TPA: hypothetical protein VLH19_05215 [Patescibacteria group bacterium]|nr:hypothetical protein [Patescibacteria group bacterium]
MVLNERRSRTAVILTDNQEAVRALKMGRQPGYDILGVVLVPGSISNEDLGKQVSRQNEGGAYEVVQAVLLFGGVDFVTQAQITMLNVLGIEVREIGYPQSELQF